MDTKHKVVLIAFVSFFAIAVLVFVFGGKSKIERFEEDEEFSQDTDDEDNEKEPPKKTKKKVVDTTSKPKPSKSEQPVNYMKEAMNYLNTMNLPFQLKKEVFTELFSEDGMSKLETLTTLPDVKKFVASIVDMTDSSNTSKSIPQKESFSESPIKSGLDEIKKQIGNLTQSLTSMSSTIDRFEKTSQTQFEQTAPSIPSNPEQMPSLTPSATPSASVKKSSTENVIEGFENVRSHYALF
jgi:hypothetical protein